jgi:hypothetical protein
MSDWGFKKLTVENWLEPDEISKLFVHLCTGEPVTANERAQSILEPSLLDSVPLPIQRLFEVARSALLYGYFFYPLYALGGEQLFRLAETAVNSKCNALGIPAEKMSLRKRVDKLIQRGIIPEQEKVLWSSFWKVRNRTSHPSDQMLVPPGDMIQNLWFVAEKINGWFGGSLGEVKTRDERIGKQDI